jgi:SAM-dependent methyltransferase
MTTTRRDTNWRELARDPSGAIACAWMKARVAGMRFVCAEGIRAYIDAQVTGRSVLDIGIVRHEITFPDPLHSPTWRHASLRRVASECWGVDILEAEIAKLRDLGVDNVYALDATGDGSLGHRFDAVHIGDVIEHVSNPVGLLRFALRHLAPGGRIYATTPSPFCWQEIVHFVRHGYGGRNAEHTAWITPSMAMEIAHRAGARLDGVGVTLAGIGHPVRRAVARLVNRLVPPEVLGGDYLYIFTSAEEPSTSPRGDTV